MKRGSRARVARRRVRTVGSLTAVALIYGVILLVDAGRERRFRESVAPFQTWEAEFTEEDTKRVWRLRREGERLEGTGPDDRTWRGQAYGTVFTVREGGTRIESGGVFMRERVTLWAGEARRERFHGTLEWRAGKALQRRNADEGYALDPANHKVRLTGVWWRGREERAVGAAAAGPVQASLRPRRMRKRPERVPRMSSRPGPLPLEPLRPDPSRRKP